MQKTILFTGSTLPCAQKSRMENLGYKVKIAHHALSEDELVDELSGVSAYILAGVEKASRQVIERAPELEIISFLGVGYQTYIDSDAATELGVAVTNTPGANSESVAEFTMAMILNAVKRMSHLMNTVKKGEWPECETWNLRGRTLGIVGLGAVGAHVAKIAHQGFGMNILYAGRTRKLEPERECTMQFVDLEQLLSESDVVSLHVNLTDETKNMIGERELALMKPHAVLINAARAGVVNPEALRTALLERRIACAAFDGYYDEPSPTVENDRHELLSLSDELFLVSPHTAWSTTDAINAMTESCVDSVVAALEGKQIKNLVNPDYVSNTKRKLGSVH